MSAVNVFGICGMAKATPTMDAIASDENAMLVLYKFFPTGSLGDSDHYDDVQRWPQSCDERLVF
jgi:hypothetical protein